MQKARNSRSRLGQPPAAFRPRVGQHRDGSVLIAIFFKPPTQAHFLLWVAITLFTGIAVLTTPLEYWPAILACVLALAGV
ncbi:MAG TPA: hypothetical protein VIY52_25275 [Streptosporangiaceae bacterium]